MEIHKFIQFLSKGVVQAKDGLLCCPMDTQGLPSGPIAPVYQSSIDIYILDHNLKPVLPGQVGSLYIGKIGYSEPDLFHPKLKTERFVDNPYDFGQIYKTGYWARSVDDSTIGYYPQHGGVRFQGYRIPVTEMVKTLEQYAPMDDCIVVPHISEEHFALIAYLSSEVDIDLNKLTEFAEERLPKCWVPTDYFVLDKFPTDDAGIDYSALPTPKRLSVVENSPKSELEVGLSQLFQHLLKLTNIDVDASFFSMGGDSLLALSVIQHLDNVYDVTLTVPVFYQCASVRQLAKKVADIKQSDLTPILPMGQYGLKLSERQKQIWLKNKLFSGQGMICSQVMRLFGSLDIGVLNFALSAVLSRHRILNLAIENNKGYPNPTLLHNTQINVEGWDADDIFAQVDQTTESWEQQNEAISFILYDAQNQPFDLESGQPLLRLGYMPLDADDHVLIISAHKMIVDAISMDRIAHELIEFYAQFVDDSCAMTLPASVDYLDYAYWSYDYEQQAQVTASFWHSYLADVPEMVLITDFPRTELHHHCRRYHFEVDDEMTQAVSDLALQYDTTRFVIMLTAFNILLHRYSQQKMFAVGVNDEGRRAIGTEKMIGAFESEYCIKLEFSEAMLIESLINQVKTELAQCQQQLPFVQERPSARQTNAVHPFYQAGFSMNANAGSAFYAAGLDIETLSVDYVNSPLDLSLDLTDGSSMLGAFVYKSDLFAESTIDRMIQHFSQIVLEMTLNCEQAIDQLPMMDATELQSIRQMLVETEHPRAIIDPSTCVLSGKFSQYAHKAALISSAGVISYEQLYQQACHIAKYLKSEGLNTNHVVAIDVQETQSQAAALLGVQLSGLGYLLIEREWTEDHLVKIDEYVGLDFCLTDHNSIISENVAKLIDIYETKFEENLSWPQKSDDDLACILCQFDENQLPMITAMSYGQVSSQISWMQRHFEMRAFDQALFDQPLNASEYCWSLMWPLSVGATLIRDGELLHDGVKACLQNPTFVFTNSVESVQQINRHMCTDHVRTVLSNFGQAEALNASIKQFFSDARHYSLFSVLQCGGPVGCYLFGKPFRAEQLQIGCPGDNVRFHIYDQKLRAMPIGLPGQFMVSGLQLGQVLTPQPVLVEKVIRNEVFHYVNLGLKARLLSNGEVEVVNKTVTPCHAEELPRVSSELADNITAVIEQLLSKQTIDLADDFFAIGGTPLLCCQLVYQLSTLFNLELPLQHMLQSRSIQDMIVIVEQCLLEQKQTLCHDQQIVLDRLTG